MLYCISFALFSGCSFKLSVIDWLSRLTVLAPGHRAQFRVASVCHGYFDISNGWHSANHRALPVS